MANTLDTLVSVYLDDTVYQKQQKIITQKRKDTLPHLQSIMSKCMRKELPIAEFSQQILSMLQQYTVWDPQGSIRNELLILLNNQYEDNSIAEYLRSLLENLTVETIGQEIETMNIYLNQEQNRLLVEEKQQQIIVIENTGAGLISHLAFWLYPQPTTIICHNSVQQGLYMLIKAHLLPHILTLKMENEQIEIGTASDYYAYSESLHYLDTLTPQLSKDLYWYEYFFNWMNTSTIFDERSNEIHLIKREDGVSIQSHESAQARESQYPSEPAEHALEKKVQSTQHQLKATKEPLLSQFIKEVQSHVFIEESVIRRIYHALLAGNVILTGPTGTGKTELARIIPEILWQSTTEKAKTDQKSTETAYTTYMVTAAEDWNTHTLIGESYPQQEDGRITYIVKYGHLTETIVKNWDTDTTQNYEEDRILPQRAIITAFSMVKPDEKKQFQGQWLLIDEINRARIDQALGDAFATLGGSGQLRVMSKHGSTEIPVPQDFRIIGTLNNFDRNQLYPLSEALKRRFSFIEISPPGRASRQAEQGITLYKALYSITDLSDNIHIEQNTLQWNQVSIKLRETGEYHIEWENKRHNFKKAFEMVWHIIEVLRIYHPLGTGQIIQLLKNMLISGILGNYSTPREWIGKALDHALCDTVIDQLYMFYPDEIEVLISYLTEDLATFAQAYNHHLFTLASSHPRRFYSQLLSLSGIINSRGHQILTDAQAKKIATQLRPEVPIPMIKEIFHLQHAYPPLPQFTRQLRLFQSERNV